MLWKTCSKRLRWVMLCLQPRSCRQGKRDGEAPLSSCLGPAGNSSFVKGLPPMRATCEELVERLSGRVSRKTWWDGVRTAQFCVASWDASEGSGPSTCPESKGHHLGPGWLQEGSIASPSHTASLEREGLILGLVIWSWGWGFCFWMLFRFLSLHPVKGWNT